MGFWILFEVASMPILQVLLISLLGAFLATDYCKLLPADTRRSLNRLVFVVFTPSLIFASLARTVTFQDIISWWFMPVNIGLTFLVGGILGWIMVKILKPKPYLEGLIIAMCSSGNLGNLVLVVVPAICNEDESPFGDTNVCRTIGLSYASFSMALGGFYIWTISFQLIKSSSLKLRVHEAVEEFASKQANNNLDVTPETHLLKGESEEQGAIVVNVPQDNSIKPKGNASLWIKAAGFLHTILEELMAPPTLGAILGFIFGTIVWLRNLIIGPGAPLRVIQDSVKLLGDATIPCITLILGANLIQGLRSSTIKPMVIVGVVCVRFIILPVVGIYVVKAAGSLGFLPSYPLFRFVLMVQFTLPPAMNIGTMTQLFNVGQDECSVLFLWTYLACAVALTSWSTLYMWILS
ncbi:AMP-dependent synthetase and ligase family protein [Hibiscus syriacus]|uniref:AMP-dependent synthetase and ligase family protein n=1 Tax=Hibiscus syriacus TaxID=106335 RepID=A0A6A3BFH8_HIBSY|nr:protein PIN-LIKES 5-like [Hibiscus syriacus]KAE8715890.1 AMP-dependent synthetase and ligase family protein [Hibiscus syriacus]